MESSRSTNSQTDVLSATENLFSDRSASIVHNTERSIGSPEKFVEKISTIHAQVLSALSQSTFLNPIHVEIRNESYWYNMRKRMGARKHAAMITKYNETYLRHEAYIYKIKLREKDMEMVPQKVHVGDAKTKWLALKLCEKACKERDENPARTKKMADMMAADKILTTHLRVLVVSEQFHRVSVEDRMGMVYEELLKQMGTNLNPVAMSPSVGGLGLSAPTRLKMGTTFGPSMCSMDLFRVLLPPNHAPFVLLVDARTPSQWRPELYAPLLSERLGTSHLELRNLQVDDAAKPAKQRLRVKKLTTVSDSRLPPLPHSPLNTERPALSDTLGLEAAVSGVKYAKLGGIYGHFFNDLSPGVREMVMLKYKDNKELIQAEGNVNVHEVAEAKRKAKAYAIEHGKPLVDTFQPHTNISALRAKATAAVSQSEYDKGTSTETAMMEEVNVSGKRVERVVVRLQRIRRLTEFRRAVKKLWWRKYAAVTIQRVVRGLFGRQYAVLYAKLKPVAAVRIQVCFRAMKTRVVLRVWRFLTFRLTRKVLPRIKLFIRNCFLSWISKRNHSATLIQSCVRVYLARARKFRMLGEEYFMRGVFVRAAVKMQQVVRGFLGRIIHRRVLVQTLIDKVDHPAALRLQRIYRGRLAKLLLVRKRYEMQCRIRIQLFVKAFVRRVWDAQLREAQRIKKAATHIQRVFRGAIDREICRMKARIVWYRDRFLPAVVFIQAVARRYQAQKNFVSLKRRAKAAAFIQQKFRNYVRRKVASAMVEQMRVARKFFAVSRIQCMARRHAAMARYRRMQLIQNGRVVQAAKMIMRAWVTFKANRKYQYLLQEHRHKLYARKIEKYIAVRRNVLLDIREIRADISLAEKVISRLKTRVREIEVFLQQASVRSVNVKLEMQKLTTDDFERGWAEALGQEYESLNYQSLMAREELRLLRSGISQRLREIATLHFELEEAEIEIDTVELVELECAEGIRRTEIQRAEKLANEKMQRTIRQEKSHWKIESNRVKVIQRNRPRYQAIVSKTQAGRDEAYSTTISFEKHAQVWDKEQLTTEQLLRLDARKQDKENKPKTYVEYAGPVQDTYDQVVANTLSLLRGFTLPERTNRLREQHKAKEVKAKRAQKGQFAPLKEEYQQRGAFEYLSKT